MANALQKVIAELLTTAVPSIKPATATALVALAMSVSITPESLAKIRKSRP